MENIDEYLMKTLILKGTLLTPRSDDYKAKLTKNFPKSPAFEEDIIQPIIHSVLSFEDLPAHRQMEASENTGK